MNKNKIFDCITFFDENLLVNARLEILKNVVDYFVICESKYDYRGFKKKINFRLINKKLKHKVRHLVLTDKFPDPKNLWKSEEFQREKIFEGIKDARADDREGVAHGALCGDHGPRAHLNLAHARADHLAP